jgi:hypothetical protein
MKTKNHRMIRFITRAYSAFATTLVAIFYPIALNFLEEGATNICKGTYRFLLKKCARFA